MANSIFRLEQWQYLEWQAALACLHAHTLCRMVTKGALLHSAAGYRQPRLSSRSAEGWSVGILLWEASKEQLQSAKALRCIFHTEKKGACSRQLKRQILREEVLIFQLQDQCTQYCIHFSSPYFSWRDKPFLNEKYVSGCYLLLVA